MHTELKGIRRAGSPPPRVTCRIRALLRKRHETGWIWRSMLRFAWFDCYPLAVFNLDRY
jgi:hypothetical protein